MYVLTDGKIYATIVATYTKYVIFFNEVMRMPKKRNPEETKNKILDASLELYRTKGYEKTTILDIVDAMGTSRGAFYHHFKTKEEVLWAILDRRETDIFDVYFEELLKESELTGIEKLRKLFMHSLETTFAGENVNLAQAVLGLMKEPKILAEQVKEVRNIEWLTPMIEQGIADGSIPSENAYILIELTQLLLQFWLFPTIFPGDLAYIKAKILLVKGILEGLEFPLIDDELLNLFIKVIEEFAE